MSVHNTAIIDEGAQIGNASIGAFCHVGSDVILHDDVVLQNNVTVKGATEIGARTIVHPFSVLGGPPQHLGCNGEGTHLKIGSDNIIREHVTMNRGTIAGGGTTSVGNNGFYMAGAHVAHDCNIGNNVIFANNATLGGHVQVGDFAFLGGLCAIHQFCRIGDYAFVGGCAAVAGDIIPFGSAIGNHAYLVGLNIIGLKRRGFSRQEIFNLRAAYRLLFDGDQTFKERVAAVREKHGDCPKVISILEFIEKGDSRPLMTPERH
ncbi:acyl-ACP--UDP-N-acetylglucosamine O-acyltransferase [Hyphococcus sp. DH-69]|uniref:acyl-ACP--UDP-N-acetylglucosamine O-acyltransferase n=1 Tax=Hyphococcus formosus TaxID=3143534 RepID=UPI00398B747F